MSRDFWEEPILFSIPQPKAETQSKITGTNQEPDFVGELGGAR